MENDKMNNNAAYKEVLEQPMDKLVAQIELTRNQLVDNNLSLFSVRCPRLPEFVDVLLRYFPEEVAVISIPSCDNCANRDCASCTFKNNIPAVYMAVIDGMENAVKGEIIYTNEGEAECQYLVCYEICKELLKKFNIKIYDKEEQLRWDLRTVLNSAGPLNFEGFTKIEFTTAPYPKSYAERLCKKLCRESNISSFSLHELRRRHLAESRELYIGMRKQDQPSFSIVGEEM